MTVLLYLFVAVLLATGLSLLWLGATLLMLGGSPYYVLAGVAITLSAILIARRNWSGVWVYAAFWLATLLWALWESGLDGWALAPRLAMPTALGLWMLTPWFRRGLRVARPLPGGLKLWTGLARVWVARLGFCKLVEGVLREGC